MLLEEVNRLLEPGYLPMETGYYRLPNGQMHVATLVRMPKSKGKMVEWFFGHYLKDTETYKQWDPKAHLRFEWDDKWSPGHYIGASHYGEEYLAGEVLKFIVKFDDPALFFDVSRFKEARVGAVVCGQGFLPDGTPDGRFVVSGSEDKTLKLWELDWELDPSETASPGIEERPKSPRFTNRLVSLFNSSKKR